MKTVSNPSDAEIESIRENRHTPCVGRCNTFYAEVCFACGRSMAEKAGWTALPETEKEAIWKRIIRQGWRPRVGISK